MSTEKLELFECSQKLYFSVKGNGIYGNSFVTGWKPSRLGREKKEIIIKALKDSHTDEVWRGKRGRVYRRLINGSDERII